MSREKFFAAVRQAPFGGKLTQSQVEGLNALLDYTPSGMSIEERAYCFATAFHETARTMQPIEEYGKGKGKPYAKGGWYGRGFVQLTWEPNYLKAGKALGVDLAANPALALDPKNAAMILFIGMREGWFTGKKLSDYFGNGKEDPVGARRIVNGTDKADLIASYYQDFLVAFSLGLGDLRPRIPVVDKIPTPPVEMKPPQGLWAKFFSSLSNLGAK